jgi:hypothetical protein
MSYRLERVTDLVARVVGFALTGAMNEQRLRSAILELATERGPASSICPSDAVRAVGGGDWRDLMGDARAVARALAREG